MAEESVGRISLDMDNTRLAKGAKESNRIVDDATKKIISSADKAEKKIQEIGVAYEQISKKAAAASRQIATSQNKITGNASQAAKQITPATSQRSQEQRETNAQKAAQTKENILSRGEQQLAIDLQRADLELRNFYAKRIARSNDRIRRESEKSQDFATRQSSPWYSLGWESRRQRVSPSSLFFSNLNSRIGASNLHMQMGQQAMLSMQGGGGMTPFQVWEQAMNRAIARSNARGMTGPSPQVSAAGGGRGGGVLSGVGRRLLGGGGGGLVGGFASGLLGGFGIGIGGYAAARAAQATIAAAETATAYERQRVAAERLAGDQEKLNQLLDAYGRASGGAIDKTTTLSNITRLLATGFADTVPEVERFVEATRGASIALGRPQDYVIQETQLAISNTSVKRLDQIGLGITEVQERTAALREENRGWTREQAFQEAVLTLLQQKYGALTDSLAGQKTGVEQLRASWSDFMLTLGQNVEGPVNKASNALAKLLKFYADFYAIDKDVNAPFYAGGNPNQRTRAMRLDDAFNQGMGDIWYQFQKAMLQSQLGAIGVDPSASITQLNAARALRSGDFRRYDRGDSGYTEFAPRPSAPVSPLDRFSSNEEVQDVIRSAHAASLQLERDYSRARLDVIRQYEEQRTNLIRDFNKQMAREEEDFQRSRARSLRDYERAVVDVMRDSQERAADLRENLDKRIAESQEALDEKLADLREDSEKRVSEIQEKYIKDREKAEADHRDKLLSAASQLNALAVYEEQKRWARENREREEAHQEALEDEKENLREQEEEAREAHEKRVEDAREALEEQLADARKADERRLDDMRVARERQLADEDEERAIRRARAVEDHNDQLAEMKRQRELTLASLKEEAEANRKALNEALEADLAEVGFYVDGYLEKIKKRDEEIAKWFDKILEKIEAIIEAEAKREEAGRIYYPGGGPMGAYEKGGFVPVTGPAMLHAGEFVLSRDMIAAGISSNSSRSLTVAPGAIQVFASSVHSEEEIARLVHNQLMETFEPLGVS